MRKMSVADGKRYVFKTHINDMVLPREQAEVLEAFNVVIEPGKYTHLHTHIGNEQIYFVTAGKGKAHFSFPDGHVEDFDMAPGNVVYIPRNTEHQIFCMSKTEPLMYFCVDGFVDRSTEKPTWDEHYQATMARLRAEDK
ncbi:MAG TPA: cupin domain-containing protein [Armatimonadota bacterium]|nr:cupin domain-containing protein [Armatimonadota bacterium]